MGKKGTRFLSKKDCSSSYKRGAWRKPIGHIDDDTVHYRGRHSGGYNHDVIDGVRYATGAGLTGGKYIK